jgi:hypothetical protein
MNKIMKNLFPKESEKNYFVRPDALNEEVKSGSVINLIGCQKDTKVNLTTEVSIVENINYIG